MNDIPMDKINEILSSPDLLKNVQSVLGQLSSRETNEILPVAASNESSNNNALEINGIVSSISNFLSENRTERIALLTALRPFLSDEKKNIIDGIVQILKASGLLTLTNKFTQGA